MYFELRPGITCNGQPILTQMPSTYHLAKYYLNPLLHNELTVFTTCLFLLLHTVLRVVGHHEY